MIDRIRNIFKTSKKAEEKKEPSECDANLIDMILKNLKSSPDSQMSPDAMKMLERECNSYGEKYDLIVEISKLDMTHISSFIRELCALDKYYLRPKN